jgi:hypothetical protein
MAVADATNAKTNGHALKPATFMEDGAGSRNCSMKPRPKLSIVADEPVDITLALRADIKRGAIGAPFTSTATGARPCSCPSSSGGGGGEHIARMDFRGC